MSATDTSPDILPLDILNKRVALYEKFDLPFWLEGDLNAEHEDDCRKTIAMIAQHSADFQRTAVNLMKWQHTAERAQLAAYHLGFKEHGEEARRTAFELWSRRMYQTPDVR